MSMVHGSSGVCLLAIHPPHPDERLDWCDGKPEPRTCYGVHAAANTSSDCVLHLQWISGNLNPNIGLYTEQADTTNIAAVLPRPHPGSSLR